MLLYNIVFLVGILELYRYIFIVVELFELGTLNIQEIHIYTFLHILIGYLIQNVVFMK